MEGREDRWSRGLQDYSEHLHARAGRDAEEGDGESGRGFGSRGNETIAKIPGKCPDFFVFGTLRSGWECGIIGTEKINQELTEKSVTELT